MDTEAEPSPERLSRRSVVAGAAGLAVAGFVGTAEWVRSSSADHPRTRLTVLGTADTHGHVYNWDYIHARAFDDVAHNDVGVAKVASLMSAVREDREGEPILTLDAGDTLQGTPLTYYYGAVHPAGSGVEHPMALAMNLMGYDAATVGNHEFNYGLALLHTFQSQVDFPLLGANATLISDGKPAFTPYVVKELDSGAGPKVKVGVLGLTNPSVMVWNKGVVDGEMTVSDLVEQARTSVPELKEKGCDVVVVVAHAGLGPGSSYGDALPFPDNVCLKIAKEVPDIDAILAGHTHHDVPQRRQRNDATGRDVLLCQPAFWGKRLSVMDLNLEHSGGHWSVVSASSQNLNSNTVSERADVAAAVQSEQDTVLRYMATPITRSTAALSAARATVEDSPVIDLVNHVQGAALDAALPDNKLPVLSIAPVIDPEAALPEGQVTLREFGGIYPAWDTLNGIVLTGAQVRDYLEYDAAAYHRLEGSGPFLLTQVFGAATEAMPQGVPPRDFDAIAGLTDRLRYSFDISRPVGSRVRGLTYAGHRVSARQRFAVAIGASRRSGGGGFPHVKTAEVLYEGKTSISDLLLDWVHETPLLDPAKFASVDWEVTVGRRALRLSE